MNNTPDLDLQIQLQALSQSLSLLQSAQASACAVALAKQGKLPVIELFQLAQLLNDEHQPDQASALYHLWLDNTDSPLAYAVLFNLGVGLANANDDPGAEQAYRRALQLKPTFIEAHCNLATLLERKGEPLEALAMWNQATAISNPGVAGEREFHVQALNNLGRLLEIRKQFPQAEAMLTKSLLLDSRQPKVLTHVIHLRQKQCKWPIYQAIAGVSLAEMVDATSALAMLSASGDPQMQLDAARRFVSEKVLAPTVPLAPGDGYCHDKLRIGYLSSDLCSHAVSILTAELYELHDRNRVEVFAFSWSREDGTPLRARVVKAMDHYISIAAMSDEEAARCIRAHEIDILVDLHGLTLGTRPDILSWRPAPVQMTYLGFPGSTALPCIDYVIADRFVLPPELAPHFTERALYMPNSFQINDRQREIGPRPTRASCALPDDGFIFCSFNNNFKFTEEVFASWMRILLRVPGSVLWLVSDHDSVRQNLRASAEQLGVDPARLLFAERAPPAEYLARYQVADLFLDTIPFNAGTTASDALWAGLPLLTCAGHTFSSRMAGSLLLAVGLPELITHTLQDYEDKAVALAQEPARIAAMKQQLMANRLTCSLFDSPQFVRDLEDMLLQVAPKGSMTADANAAQTRPISISTLPLVSVLIPTHNRPDYLEIALKSVLEQSYENIEIIISDNGDDGLSEQRIAPYLERHPNIIYYRKQGMSALENFGKCLELSQGEYINYLMDDDVFHPEKIKRMMHYYLHHPNIGLVTSFRQLIDEHGHDLPPLPGTERMFPIDTLVTGLSFGNMMLSNGTNLIGEPTTVLLRRCDVGDVFGTFAGRNYSVLVDIATWLSILATRDCVYISDALSYFRIHAAQDQRGNMMKIKASMEWFGLISDAHKNQLFLQDRTEFLNLLAAKIAAFTAYIAVNHAEIRDGNYNLDDINGVIQNGYQLLLEK